MSEPKEPSRAQQLVGDFAPKLAQLTDDVLFGDVWERAELSPRDRSLVRFSPGSGVIQLLSISILTASSQNSNRTTGRIRNRLLLPTVAPCPTPRHQIYMLRLPPSP